MSSRPTKTLGYLAALAALALGGSALAGAGNQRLLELEFVRQPELPQPCRRARRPRRSRARPGWPARRRQRQDASSC